MASDGVSIQDSELKFLYCTLTLCTKPTHSGILKTIIYMQKW